MKNSMGCWATGIRVIAILINNISDPVNASALTVLPIK